MKIPERERRWSRENYRRNPSRVKANVKRWRDDNREKALLQARVREQVRRAILAGRLTRPTICERCGAEAYIEAAHVDYLKPFEISWLCRPCHRSWDHKQPKLYR